jgi:hypothetical protein
MQELLDQNLALLGNVALLAFPTWFSYGELNTAGLTVITHEYDFLEYRDSDGNVLMRHTLGNN